MNDRSRKMNDKTVIEPKLYLTICPLKKSNISQDEEWNLMNYRYRLHTRKQGNDESFNNFYEDLQFLVKRCQFTDDSVLRDHIVFGIKYCDIREQLLAHGNPSLESVVEICRNKESMAHAGDTESLGQEGEGWPHSEDQNETIKQEIKFENEEYLEDWENEFSDTSSINAENSGEPPVKPKLEVRNVSAEISGDSNICQTEKRKGGVSRARLTTAADAQQQSTSSSALQSHTEDVIKKESSEISTPTSHMEQNSAPHQSYKQINKIITKQSARKLYLCGVCGRNFKQKHHLSEHISYHTKLKLHCYEVSSNSVDRKELLSQHMSIHTKQKAHFCDVCNKSFATKELLSQHTLVHTTQKPHCCEICKKSFDRKELLSQHMLIHSTQKPYCCEVCNKSFGRKESLSRHMLIHTKQKPHCCEVCSKNFSLKLTLSRHMLIHTGQKPHCCKVCSKGFARTSTLSEHMLIHTKQKPQSCEICSKSFARKSTLSQHMLTHSELKSHCCEVCKRCFSRKELLLRHILIHTEQKPHCCNVCSKSFVQKGTLSRHMQTHTHDNDHT